MSTATISAPSISTPNDLKPQSDINAILKADMLKDIGAPTTAPTATSIPPEPVLATSQTPPPFTRPNSLSRPSSLSSSTSTKMEVVDVAYLKTDSVHPAVTNEDHLLLHDLKAVSNADNWVASQEKTFLRWVNYYLSQRDLKVESMTTAFSDGHLLNNLLEILSGKRLPRWRVPPCKTQVQRLDNLSVGFAFMQQEGIRLVNVRIQEIEAGNAKIIMALVWSLIVYYQIERIAKMAHQKAPTSVAGSTAADMQAQAMTTIQEDSSAAVLDAPKSAPVTSAKSELLGWVNSKVGGYDVPAVRDFTSSWVDGRVLTALTDVLLIEQANLISLLTKAAIEHKPEEVNAAGLKVLHTSGEHLADASAAILRAENELRIPPLLDAADLVNSPNEQAVMTYIACFRDREQTLANVGQQTAEDADTADTSAAVEEEAPLPVLPPPASAEVAAAVSSVTAMSTPTHATAAATTVVTTDVVTSGAVSERVDDGVTIAPGSSVAPMTETVQPTIVPVTALPANVSTSGVVITESAETATAAAVVTAERPPLQINPSAAPSTPRGLPGTPVNQSPRAASAASPVAVAGFAEAGPTLSRSDEVKEVDVCMTNVDLQYVQARPDGALTVTAANTTWSVWTVIDSHATDIVYFRDHKGRYITSDGSGRVFMAPKSEQAKWKVQRGKSQNFRDLQGLYLTAADGQVFCAKEPGMHAELTLNFPVIEGVLRKKGRSGLKRWQARYFAFNGAVMSYWEKKEDAGVTTVPKGLWYPKDISSVSVDKREDAKFYLHFKDGQAVALDAMQASECLRWVHSLEMTGVPVSQQ